MLPNITIKLTLGERSIVIRKGGQLRLNSITGIESPDYDVQTAEYSAMPGGYLSSSHVPVRPISFTFTVDNKAQTENMRQTLIAFFDMEPEGELEITRTGITRRIQCRCGSAPVFSQPNIRQDKLKVTVSLICMSPFFQSTIPVEIRFGEATPLFMFPLTIFPSAGLTVGMPGTTDTTVLNNDGHVNAGLVMTVKAVGGDVVNPAFWLDNSYVKALITLAEGDEMVIDTRAGKKSLKINGENRLIFDRGSTFFQCPPGRHTLRVDADNGKEYAQSTANIVYAYKGV